MPQYLFVYHMGDASAMPEDAAAQEAGMEKWRNWMGSMGDALVVPGNPVGKSNTVSAAGVTRNGGPNPAAGYSIVEAADMDEALKMAKGCPILEGGTVEVAPIIEM